MSGLSRSEQETVVTVDMEERLVRIYTSVPKHMRAFSKNDEFTLVSRETQGGELVAMSFTIPEERYRIGATKRKSNMSDAQKAEAVKRLQMARRNFQK